MSVSTIIPVFNRADMVVEAIESVLQQTYRPVEVIVVDDGSEDDTAKRVEDLSRRRPEPIRVLRQANRGPGPARNLGLSAATGEFIQYLDSDDLLAPSKFERQVAALQARPDADVSYCVTLRRDSGSGQLKAWARTDQPIDHIFPSFLPQRGWATLTPLWRRSACERIGPWGDFRVMEDWEHDLRAGMLGVVPVQVPEPLCTVRDHDSHRASGMNTGFTPDITHEFFRAHESVWHHMKRYGLTDWDYVGRFSRTMFWVARMCGARGLAKDMRAALAYVDEMTEINRQRNSTKAFRFAAGILGWRAASLVSEGIRSKVRERLKL